MMRAQGVSFIATAWPASAKEVIGRSISVGRSICATELCRAGASALDAAGCSTNASLTQQSIMIMAQRMSRCVRAPDVGRKVVEVWGGNYGMSAVNIPASTCPSTTHTQNTRTRADEQEAAALVRLWFMALSGARCPLGRGGHLLAPHVYFASPAPRYYPPLAQRASHLREGRADGGGRLFAGGVGRKGQGEKGWRPDEAQRASHEACSQRCDSVAVEGGADEP